MMVKCLKDRLIACSLNDYFGFFSYNKEQNEVFDEIPRLVQTTELGGGREGATPPPAPDA